MVITEEKRKVPLSAAKLCWHSGYGAVVVVVASTLEFAVVFVCRKHAQCNAIYIYFRKHLLIQNCCHY